VARRGRAQQRAFSGAALRALRTRGEGALSSLGQSGKRRHRSLPTRLNGGQKAPRSAGACAASRRRRRRKA
jgi:hypothetical protein